MYVIVVGAGKVGYYLSKRLMNEGHEVLLMEKDRRRAAMLVEELGDVVMQGDGCEIRVMSEAGFGRADTIVAVTGDDEDNLVVCQMAKRQFSVPRTIARVNNPINEDLFSKLGIDTSVSSTALIYNMIDQQIEPGQIIPIGALRKGNIEIVTINISENSPVLGRPVKDIGLPDRALIISIIRDENALLPQGDTRFMPGDSVIALVSTQDESSLRSVFTEAG
ncbi:MAG: NAD-binding protein [Capsulimonadaceae bacterium]|nr:NAD-binding protein [Capsulimonadaceae bacterium]